MTLVEFIKAELVRLHGSLDHGVKDLTPEQWHAVPAGNARANTIAFEMWHYARTEDNIVRFIIQNRRPTVWMEGKWAERLGLPPVAQGTGMPPADAQAMRIADLDAIQAVRAGRVEEHGGLPGEPGHVGVRHAGDGEAAG